MNDDFSETVKKCMEILEDNVDFLSNLEQDLNDEKEDEIVPQMELYQLYDMAEDVGESIRLKRAESNMMNRYTKESF